MPLIKYRIRKYCMLAQLLIMTGLLHFEDGGVIVDICHSVTMGLYLALPRPGIEVAAGWLGSPVWAISWRP